MDRSSTDIKSTHRCVRVMHVFRKLDVGGAEMRMLDIARRLDPSRFELHVCVFSEEPGELGPELASLGAKIHQIRLGPSFPLIFKRLLRRKGIDVVHPHMHYSSGFVLRLATQVGTAGRIAHFQSCSDGQGDGIRRRLQRHVMRSWINKFATDIVTCGKTVMARSWSPQWKADPRCRVIFDGIDPDLFRIASTRDEVAYEFGLEQRAPLFIHVGNFRRPKNHLRLVSIFHQLLADQPHAKLLLVGRDSDGTAEALKSKVAEVGITNSVIFAGSRSDVVRLMRAADAMIFPSLWEGLPGVVLEACAAGVPVLASDLPEVREIAHWLPLVNCISLEEDDRSWAQAALSLTQEEVIREASSKASLSFANSPFHMDECVSQFCQLWQAAALGSEGRYIQKAA